ncbi:unnamed protein product [Medioppia subpectinata]|uniref:Carboxylic ester hydrolase n=1 Tax=Medioppia subpectinata TaxID=1979941 RepID=A0A7R9L1Y3_9ACAR|nr:unnamed protein product [Medioppia subpectinata]CAG2112818.1 unnamed protein product [Medioppia subpectinata]
MYISAQYIHTSSPDKHIDGRPDRHPKIRSQTTVPYGSSKGVHTYNTALRAHTPLPITTLHPSKLFTHWISSAIASRKSTHSYPIDKLFVHWISFRQYPQTTSGVVRGQTLRVLNKTVDQFLNIPYAEPPIGALRFAKPVPLKQTIKNIINRMNEYYAGHTCIQSGRLAPFKPLSEDCLVLNIWTPNAGNNNTNKSQLKPIMFHIHGGDGLDTGTIFSTLYNGSFLAAHDLIIVSANYRLGQLGFLYGDREDAPGNVGFYDQLLALKWIRENAEQFGGDRDQMTIFGESAGSWSVSAHILSPLSKGLFKRAIMESGSVMFGKGMEPITKSEALVLAKNTAKQLNCSESEDWLKCLRGVDALEFPKTITHEILLQKFITFPVFGTEFLPISTQKAFESKQINSDIDLMVCLASDVEESQDWISYRGSVTNISVEIFKQMVAQSGQLGFHQINTQNVTDFYLKNVNTTDESALFWAFHRFASDMALNCPTYLFGQQFSRNVKNNARNVQFYELNYGHRSNIEAFGYDPDTMRIDHNIDMPYVFGIPFNHGWAYSKHDRDYSINLMRLWTNFAKYGKPDNNWPKLLTNNTFIIKDLNPFNTSRVLDNPFHSTCDGFWRDYYL